MGAAVERGSLRVNPPEAENAKAPGGAGKAEPGGDKNGAAKAGGGKC
jgi:hypothetical protein